MERRKDETIMWTLITNLANIAALVLGAVVLIRTIKWLKWKDCPYTYGFRSGTKTTTTTTYRDNIKTGSESFTENCYEYCVNNQYYHTDYSIPGEEDQMVRIFFDKKHPENHYVHDIIGLQYSPLYLILILLAGMFASFKSADAGILSGALGYILSSWAFYLPGIIGYIICFVTDVPYEDRDAKFARMNAIGNGEEYIPAGNAAQKAKRAPAAPAESAQAAQSAPTAEAVPTLETAPVYQEPESIAVQEPTPDGPVNGTSQQSRFGMPDAKTELVLNWLGTTGKTISAHYLQCKTALSVAQGGYWKLSNSFVIRKGLKHLPIWCVVVFIFNISAMALFHPDEDARFLPVLISTVLIAAVIEGAFTLLRLSALPGKRKKQDAKTEKAQKDLEDAEAAYSQVLLVLPQNHASPDDIDKILEMCHSGRCPRLEDAIRILDNTTTGFSFESKSWTEYF